MNKARGFLLAAGAALAMAFTVSCDIKGVGGGGTFTLTGIPAEYNGKYVRLTAMGTSIGKAANAIDSKGATGILSMLSAVGTGGGIILGFQNEDKLSQISNGSVSIPMWTGTLGGLVRYSGNDTAAVTITIHNTINAENDTPPIGVAGFGVIFSNGSAAKSWSEGRGMNLQPATQGGSR